MDTALVEVSVEPENVLVLFLVKPKRLWAPLDQKTTALVPVGFAIVKVNLLEVSLKVTDTL